MLLRINSIALVFGMRLQWSSTWLPLTASPYVAYAVGPYPVSPDAQRCSGVLGRPLGPLACQAVVNNLPRGTLPSIFTTRARTPVNNYIQVPVLYTNAGPDPACMVTIDLDGHSLTDQFIFVPWDEVRKMAQSIVDSCVSPMNRGGYITYGIGRTLQSLVHPTTYEGNNADIPTPIWVRQPDETINYVAIPSTPAADEYSELCGNFPKCSIGQGPHKEVSVIAKLMQFRCTLLHDSNSVRSWSEAGS